MRLFSLDILYEYYLFQPEAVPRLVSELRDRVRFYSQHMNSPECLLEINSSKPRSRGYLNNRYHLSKQNYQHQCLRRFQHWLQSLINWLPLKLDKCITFKQPHLDVQPN
ncbi:hypothetical protein [Chlorogloea sp. CCALA 695]|uniref:hypothetical protein n=1 Tax=Chlorogloea sp. CCALA 695 TaxID=2107693 RepID=UPI0011B1F655|nr:hypothetical protein [Chlorogloea sp. CCALA 695]